MRHEFKKAAQAVTASRDNYYQLVPSLTRKISSTLSRRSHHSHHFRKTAVNWLSTLGQVQFGVPVCVPALALASCALHCALEEWATGVALYISLADLNLQKILNNSYLCAKLETLWARIYGRGLVGVGTPSVRHVRAMRLFVADIDTSLVTGQESALTNNPWPPLEEPRD
ncbi:hypothetical protein EDB84DRAFT_1441794 [Lactarius hengduanensis]|nr:hypothetical protein EDB84DRAFT_1441794 [Lactarius hengduanensis]